MPLTYDDIGGSWGKYSKDWPSFDFQTEKAIYNARVAIVKKELVPYGCYVTVGTVLRTETREQLDKVLRHMKVIK